MELIDTSLVARIGRRNHPVTSLRGLPAHDVFEGLDIEEVLHHGFGPFTVMSFTKIPLRLPTNKTINVLNDPCYLVLFAPDSMDEVIEHWSGGPMRFLEPSMEEAIGYHNEEER